VPVAHSNSPLAVFRQISPNRNSPRNQPIRKITIHHTAGVIGIESLGAWFAQSSTQASSNYGIGSDGRVGLYVEEKDRAWTSSSPANDHQAVTIEVSNSAVGGNWPVSDAALAAVIELCADICKRNGIDRLVYTGTSAGNLTRHDLFAATNCPGVYLGGRFPYIAEEVNRRIGQAATQVVTAPAAIGVLHRHGVISSPDYWQAHYMKVQYLDALLINMANKINTI
jgi:hypothetical protein